MAEEDKKEEDKQEDKKEEDKKEDPASSSKEANYPILEESKKIIDNLTKLNEQLDSKLKKLDEGLAEMQMRGKGFSGSAIGGEKKEETPAEYAKRVMANAA